jgi:hypothetical protein
MPLQESTAVQWESVIADLTVQTIIYTDAAWNSASFRSHPGEGLAASGFFQNCFLTRRGFAARMPRDTMAAPPARPPWCFGSSTPLGCPAPPPDPLRGQHGRVRLRI